MKRGAQETASSSGKQPRLNPIAAASSTVLQPRLVLRPDAISMEGPELEGGQETDSGSDHSSADTEDESDEDDSTSTEVRLKELAIILEIDLMLTELTLLFN